MIAANVNPKDLSTFMGQASIAITFDVYGHLMPGGQARARDQMEAYLDALDGAPGLRAVGD